MVIIHPFEPIFDSNSKILILGSLPSVRSRAEGFYYGHPQNRFWKLMALIYHTDVLKTTDEKKAFLLENGIALWDVIHSCEITGSSDSSIRHAIPNNLSEIFQTADIRAVYTNGKTADAWYRKYNKREAHCLPSTSPANASWTIAKLEEAWRVIVM
jgi:hypoxanthine-DNA glycosylase